MQPKRLKQWLVLAALAILVLSGCAPRPGQGQTAGQEGAELAVDLPALVIDLQPDGSLSLGGAPLATLAAGFGVAGLDAVQLTPEQVTTLTDANIQHIQINNLPDGLKLLVNGEEIPTVVWDAESLAALQTLAGQLDEGVPPILQQLVPVLGNVGVGVTVRVPLAQGAELIPLEVTGEGSAAADTGTAQQDFLDSVGTPAQIRIPIVYAADGSWQLADMSDSEWIALTGQSALESLRLTPDLIASLQAADINSLTVSTDETGLHLTVNDQPLPYLNWGEGRLGHAISLAAGAGLLGDDSEALAATVEALLPIITTSQVEIQLLLPSE